MQSMDNLKNLASSIKPTTTAGRSSSNSIRPSCPKVAVSVKHKELIALAVALTIQCNYCLELHRQGAETAGASQEEIAETILIAGALRAGAALTHGTQVLAD